jgi:hypothetical protein
VPHCLGFHGTDEDPTHGTAEYLCDCVGPHAEDGYVVLTEADAPPPEVPAGWLCERYEIPMLPFEVGEDDVQQVVAMREAAPGGYHFAVMLT